MKIEKLKSKSRLLEKELLSKLITDVYLTPKISSIISEDDFYNFKFLFNLISDCAANNKNIQIELSTSGIPIADFLEYSYRDLKDIARDLKEVSNSIKLHVILEQAISEIPETEIEPYVAEIQRQMLTGIKGVSKSQSEINQIVKEWKDKREFYKEKLKNKNGIIGISTGYDKLDEVIDGLRPEHLWIIGGYTNVGKTAGSLNIVANLIQQGKRVVYYSLEMSQTDIISRLLGIMTDKSGLAMIKGFESDEVAEESLEKIIKSNLTIHTQKSFISEIQFSIYEENLKPVDLFVIDFVQLVMVKGAKSEYETITTSALTFQQIAKALKIPIILLSQISNEGAKNTDSPVMSFKGSGALASAADLAIEITVGETDRAEWKRKMYAGEKVNMIWNIRKNRHGKVGYINMQFNGKTGIFNEDLKDF